ncbi:23S ribosomal RNA methyltransferase [Gonapodya prolifera JEL478]|uniref:rRNA methyltransferase 2, mitochondrial n=1 Tax=Gonapodya prolifera (strain JEL478) TaxID=1344416 RepID=A0A139ARK6_GONPJ|nr:23S ribosomal RNA methyltransferase [Gonapodya prolifera JEL478]|eukprot:KXS19125.1 23S ribosomal RNA methyltransferase [Gonapodya prolifera JEL478]
MRFGACAVVPNSAAYLLLRGSHQIGPRLVPTTLHPPTPLAPKSIRLASSKSSAQWADRQSRDPYVKKRGKYRSRAAFKLKDIVDMYMHTNRGDPGFHVDAAKRAPLLKKGMIVVDCGAAPGGWSQVAAELVINPLLPLSHPDNGHVVSIDLLPLTPPDPIPGTTFLQRDMTSHETLDLVREVVRQHTRTGVEVEAGAQDTEAASSPPKGGTKTKNNLQPQGVVNAVISDMAPNISGVRTADTARSVELCQAALEVALELLTRDPFKMSLFICKSFGGPDEKDFVLLLRSLFYTVHRRVPPATRKDSSESYLVCVGLKAKAKLTFNS